MRSWFVPAFATVALAAGLLTPPAARAQTPIDLRVVEAGHPLAGVEAYVAFQGEAFRTGVTDADGRIPVPRDLVGLEDGDVIDAYSVECSGGRSVVLVPRGESIDPIVRGRRQQDPSCASREAGLFLWGDDVTIDLSTGAAMARRGPREEAAPPAPPEAGPVPRGAAPRWVVAAGGGYAVWPNLDLACGGAGGALASCDLVSEGPTARAEVGVHPWPDRPFGVRAAFGWTPGLQVDETYSAGTPGAPARNVVDLDVFTFAGYGTARWPIRERLDLALALGYVWALNRADVTTTFGAGDLTVTDTREDSGGRVGALAGLDWWARSGRWGVRLEVGGMTGKSDDIDASWHAGALLLVPVGSR